MTDMRILLHVSPLGATGTYNVSATIFEEGMVVHRTPLMLCDSAELPSDLCELLHEMTGLFIPSSGGVFG